MKKQINDAKTSFRAITLSVSLTLGFSISGYLNQDVELISPITAPPVFAKESEYTKKVYDSYTKGIQALEEKKEFSIEDYICEVFGEECETALKIAECESKLNPEVIGDKDLTMTDSKWNEMVGDSIGLFQIRTGGKGWNRARANDMTAEEFRTYLKDSVNNINYAKEIYDRQGWSPWTCARWI